MRERNFDVLVRAHSGAVLAYARSLTADRFHAEDALQETFLRAWKHIDTFSADGSFEGWLIRICRNVVIDQAQKRQRSRTVSLDAQDERSSPDSLASVHTLGTGVVDLLDTIASLPVMQREILVVCGILGYPYEEAAVLLDLPVGTIRSRLSRARAALAELLDSTSDSDFASRAVS